MLERAIITVTGMQGSGKTTWLKPHVARCRRAIFADPEGKWSAQHPGDVFVDTAEQLLDYLGAIGASDPAVPFRVIYRREHFERMRDAAPKIAFALRNLTLVLEELTWFSSASVISPELEQIIQVGRERFINLIGTTQRPQRIHGSFFDQANLVCIFRTQPGPAMQRLKRDYPDAASEAPNLRLHECRTFGDASVVQLLGREGLARSR